MDHLKQGINLRGYGQKDPLVEYKKESYVLFQEMMGRIEDETLRYLYFLQAVRGEAPPLPFPEDDWDEDEEEPAPARTEAAAERERAAAQASLQDFTRNIQKKKDREMAELQFAGGDTSANGRNKQVFNANKVGRNDPCPCGSGKKFKKCHGAS
jgi:preprotein translocase subunit SecA